MTRRFLLGCRSIGLAENGEWTSFARLWQSASFNELKTLGSPFLCPHGLGSPFASTELSSLIIS